MKAFFLTASIALTIFSVLFIFDFEGDLEKIKLGDLGISKGQSLKASTDELNNLLVSSGEEWRVLITDNVGVKKAHTNFGGGGNGLLIAQVARQYGCKFTILNKEKIIIIY